MKTTLRLYSADLHYPEDLQLHTAASGRIGSLAARFLQIERSDGFRGIGEIRANITYLSHIPEDQVDPLIRDLCRKLDWSCAPEGILSTLQNLQSHVPHVACAAVENALLEGIAQQRKIPVAELLGGTWRAEVETNQCLFWSPDERFERLAMRFLGEGFRQLKVRIAVGEFSHDVKRLARLRELTGPDISIAVDANGSWTADEAIEKCRALEPFNLSYIEQPTHPGDWLSFKKAMNGTSIPLMVDEGLASEEDTDTLCAIGAKALAHLKIVKLGGPSAIVAAMKRFRDAGVGVMIGQMNEGAMATAITVHCVMALAPLYAELYGCYGLLDDVTSGVRYAGGKILTPSGPGLGVAFDASRCETSWIEQIDS